MKPPPDEKTIEMLRDATRGSTERGKRRIILAVIALVVLALVGRGVVVEETRQAGIRESRGEAQDAADELRSRYAHVSDWPAWYRERIPGSWAGREYAIWVRMSERWMDSNPQLDEWSYAMEDALEFEASEYPRPSRAELIAVLATTAWLQSWSARLCQYECLTPPPAFENNLPHITVIDRLYGARILGLRVAALWTLGREKQAWEELDVMLRMTMAMDRPAALVDAMISLGMERMTHDLLANLMRTGSAPLPILKAWTELPDLRDSYDHELLQTEIAWLVQITAQAEPRYWSRFGESDDDLSGRYSYLDPSLDWDDRRDAFDRAEFAAKHAARYMRALASLDDAMKSGGDFRNWTMPEMTFMANMHELILTNRLTRATTRVLAQSRLAEAKNEDVATVFDANSDFELVRGESEWTIRVKLDSELAKSLRTPDETDAEFSERFKLIRLAPTR